VCTVFKLSSSLLSLPVIAAVPASKGQTMPHEYKRRNILLAGVGLGTTLWLPHARACEFSSSTLRVTHPWARASKPGQSTAVVSMKIDEVLQSDRLIAVETPVAAGAVMVSRDGKSTSKLDFVFTPGTETEIGESGTRLQLVGLKFPLEVARSYDLRLIFEKGGVMNADLSIDYA
jgi:copper(I)-binding protein